MDTGAIPLALAPHALLVLLVVLAAAGYALAARTGRRDVRPSADPPPAQEVTVAVQQAPSTPPSSGLPLSGVRILLAEDQPIPRELFAAGLSHLGAEVTTVANGIHAVATCLKAEDERRPFHLALLDYRMPECDGAGAAFVLRTSRYSGEVVGLTAGIDPDEAQRWHDNGCSFVLPKSIGPADVAKRLVALIDFRKSPPTGA